MFTYNVTGYDIVLAMIVLILIAMFLLSVAVPYFNHESQSRASNNNSSNFPISDTVHPKDQY